MDDTNKLGAIGDIHFVYKRHKLSDDLIIVAGDNLFDSPLTGFVKTCRSKKAPVVALYDVGNLEAIKRYNNITTDATGRITFFEEKPLNPRSTLTAIAIYFYPRRTLQMLDTYIREGNNPDQPGRLIQWLYKREPVYTHVLEGTWYDIGSLETLEEANRVFARSKVHA
jgi:glucose-1-phosphate thymidylyltransferase